LLEKDEQTIADFIENSLLFKKKIIEIDEFDKGERILLNFAHTFGHAIETVTQYEIPHGIAVAIGMNIANRISFNRGWLDAPTVERIEALSAKAIGSITHKNFNTEAIIDAIKNDKKRQTAGLTAILMKAGYSLEVIHDLQASEIEKALANCKQL